MQYAVPQFIEVEDKVIGPLTVRQFLYMVIGGVMLLIIWSLADLSLFIILALIVVIVVVAFSFVKINGRPFQIFLLSIIHYFSNPRLRVWFREPALEKIKASSKEKKVTAQKEMENMVFTEGQRLVKSKLQEVSNTLDRA
ncbi:PrgI family protein [Patescibacteria group bacterium]|nr:PrgI family protein [Patescibacteria group bacterium]